RFVQALHARQPLAILRCAPIDSGHQLLGLLHLLSVALRPGRQHGLLRLPGCWPVEMLLLHLLVQLQLGAQVLPELSSLALVRLLDLLEASLGLLVLLLQELNGVHACPPKVALDSPFSAFSARGSKTAANLRTLVPLESRWACAIHRCGRTRCRSRFLQTRCLGGFGTTPNALRHRSHLLAQSPIGITWRDSFPSGGPKRTFKIAVRHAPLRARRRGPQSASLGGFRSRQHSRKGLCRMGIIDGSRSTVSARTIFDCSN